MSVLSSITVIHKGKEEATKLVQNKKSWSLMTYQDGKLIHNNEYKCRHTVCRHYNEICDLIVKMTLLM